MRVLFLVLLSCVVLTASAADHYATSAAEANILMAAAKAGERVIMKNGRYPDAVISFHNTGGTREQPITFAAETPGKVSFEGNSSLAFSGSHIIIEGFTWQNGGEELKSRSVIDFRTRSGDANYATLRDCAIINYNVKDGSQDNKWIGIHGQYNTVTRCFLNGKTNLGATLTVWLKDQQEAHHTISYNYFLDRQNGPDADNGLETIRIGDSKTSFTNAHCVVAFNRFEDCDGEIEAISNKSCHNSYLHNTFFNNDGGLTLRHGNNSLVDGNVFDGGTKERSYGVRIIGEGHVVTNNYFYNLKGSDEPFRAPVTTVMGLINTPLNGYFQVRRAIITGNIFVNNTMPAIRLGAKYGREGLIIPPDTVHISNNLFYDDAGTRGYVFEDLAPTRRLTVESNNVAAAFLRSPKKGFEKHSVGKRNGFEWIKDSDGNLLASAENRTPVQSNAGANWIDPSLTGQLRNKKYTLLSPADVGPRWMNQ